VRRVVVNADDFGLSDGICRSIVQLLDAQAVGNTTMMVGAPRAVETISRWTPNRLLGYAGVHLHLSGGSPVSPAADVPSLLAADRESFPARPIAESLDPDEVYLEWGRQIELAVELLGGPPTHIDSHHGAHRIPACVEPYLALATRYGIPVRGGTSEFGEDMRRTGVSGVVEVVRGWTGLDLGSAGLLAQVAEAFERESVGDDAVIEVISHPGFSDSYLASLSLLNTQREGDHAALLDLARRNAWCDAGYALVRYPDLETPAAADGVD
jgi:predicted glycoside hydrolase/deacetylase ChbG (UPF0249 family)